MGNDNKGDGEGSSNNNNDDAVLPSIHLIVHLDFVNWNI